MFPAKDKHPDCVGERERAFAGKGASSFFLYIIATRFLVWPITQSARRLVRPFLISKVVSCWNFVLDQSPSKKKAALVTFSAFAFPNQVVTFSDLLLSRISCFPSRLYGVVLAGLCPASIAICWSLCICGCSWTSWMRIHREVNSSSCVASVILFPLKLANPCIISYFQGKVQYISCTICHTTFSVS